MEFTFVLFIVVAVIMVVNIGLSRAEKRRGKKPSAKAPGRASGRTTASSPRRPAGGARTAAAAGAAGAAGAVRRPRSGGRELPVPMTRPPWADRPETSEKEPRETLRYSKSGEAKRGVAGRRSMMPAFRFAGLQDDVKDREELRRVLHEQGWADGEDQPDAAAARPDAEGDEVPWARSEPRELTPATTEPIVQHMEDPWAAEAVRAETEPAPKASHVVETEPEPSADPVPVSSPEPVTEPATDPEPDPEPESANGTGYTPTTSFELGSTPTGTGSSSSGYTYSSIGSVYTSTSVYTSSSGLGQDASRSSEGTGAARDGATGPGAASEDDSETDRTAEGSEDTSR